MKDLFLKSLIHLLLLTFIASEVKSQNGTNVNPCIENLSSAERDNLTNIPDGKLIFNTTSNCLNYYQQKQWRVFCEEERESENVKYNRETGKLDYLIDDEWISFTMVPEENPKEEEIQIRNEISENSVEDETNLDLPVDCRTKPTRPYAGRDLVSFDVVELEGNTPFHGLGFWEILRGEGGSFVDSTVANTQFFGVQGTTYYLRWTISTECDTLFDECMVRIRPPCDPEPSQSFAGEDQFNVIEASLSANFPRSGKGSWTIVSGLGGQFSDHFNPKSNFKGKPGETYVLRWIIRNECGLTQDDIIVSIKPPCSPLPSHAYAGEDQIDIEKCRLNAELPEVGKGKWRVLEGEKGKFYNKENSHSSFYGKPGETYVLQWLVSTDCGTNSDEVVIQFASYCPDEFTDFRDGKEYSSMRIAGQCWMTENLNYQADDIESYCYDGYPDYCNQFGALYSWNAAMQGKSKEGSQGVCPEGWHIPTNSEWQLMIDSGGYSGVELQLGGVSGFNVPMSGARYTNGKYLNRREYAYFWSSTSKDEKTAWNRYFPYKSNNMDNFPTDKNHSFSIRCVKND